MQAVEHGIGDILRTRVAVPVDPLNNLSARKELHRKQEQASRTAELTTSSSRFSEIDLVLHIGLHKTGTTYLQNLFSRIRPELRQQGILYPETGIPAPRDFVTRDGANSGHGEFTRRKAPDGLFAGLLKECEEGTSSILLSSENFTLWTRENTHELVKTRFSPFKRVSVVVCVRRQDRWLESYYKQIIDGYVDFETRSFEQFVLEVGPKLVNFFDRLRPWCDAVGAENFHVLSYDDIPDARETAREIVAIAGGNLDEIKLPSDSSIPHYPSIQNSDVYFLRILNLASLGDRDERTRIVQRLTQGGTGPNIPLMTPDIRKGIRDACIDVNRRLSSEWMRSPAPNFCFEDFIEEADMPELPVELRKFLQRFELAVALSANAESRPRRPLSNGVGQASSLQSRSPKAKSTTRLSRKVLSRMRASFYRLEAKTENRTGRYLFRAIRRVYRGIRGLRTVSFD